MRENDMMSDRSTTACLCAFVGGACQYKGVWCEREAGYWFSQMPRARGRRRRRPPSARLLLRSRLRVLSSLTSIRVLLDLSLEERVLGKVAVAEVELDLWIR